MVSGPTGRWSWSEEAKARIVTELFAAGSRVVDVARHAVSPQQVTAWRRLGDCQEFRVQAMTMGRKEPTHGTPQRTGYP